MFYAWMLLTLLVTTGTQDAPKGQFPDGWTVRLDDAAGHAGHGAAPAGGPSTRDISFVTMKPGWHITTGPSAILYQPTQKASGAYTLKSEIFLFDPGERLEAFGVLLGGRNLDGPDQSYTYFVIRRTGEFLVRRRTGATTINVKEWTAHQAIKKYEDRAAGKSSVLNVLEVKVAADTTAFMVNGTEVARVATKDVDTDGIVGLRVNHQLNLHVSALDIVK
ncbi:hypothetical protein LuPra_03778 [Luteitalea pratensis]|uniref:3-keto-disaccharide hydrolase domain-containing protein n=1 Tax=Luteitalea pratensis TaxID=1855912 RepID=A0A143PPK5_LUTPR|nr:hypothetical protein [Luteitalea pratensis]AMY10542.1 hypothetical protein LuPra_03778 [Luteitalea pratensis]